MHLADSIYSRLFEISLKAFVRFFRQLAVKDWLRLSAVFRVLLHALFLLVCSSFCAILQLILLIFLEVSLRSREDHKQMPPTTELLYEPSEEDRTDWRLLAARVSMQDCRGMQVVYILR